MHRKYWFVLFFTGLFILACKKDNAIKEEIANWLGFVKPGHFPEPVYNFKNNPVTENGFNLGKALFNEPRLSRNNTITCSSCHIQSSAFTQHGHDVSHGIDDRLGTRNSPPIMNLAWSSSFMWGGGIFDLDLQPINPITAHEEMDESLANVLKKISATAKYPPMFKAAFGSEEITTSHLMKALSQFMVMCVSSNSKYDKVMRKEPGIDFTSEEQSGYVIFKDKCASCHKEPLFTDGSFRNNGLGISPVNDQGLYGTTLRETDRYKFKVPSLRNLKYTAPYMHDGRFLSLTGVLEHYNSEVKHTPNLDPVLQQTGSMGIPLNSSDKAKITAFLATLNDTDFISNTLLAEQ